MNLPARTPNPSQSVRDLTWLLTSQGLIDRSVSAARVDQSLESAGLNFCGEELNEFLNRQTGKGSHRVGRYFERLVLFYLERIRKVEIVAAGLQIQEGGRTVGELDFVFRDEQGQLQHWEAAVKFYLHFSGEHISGSHLIGPDPRDNFERKMRRLFEHQLPLSERVFSDIAERHVFVKGRVFYHPESPPPNTLLDQLSPDHLRGHWIYSTELSWLVRLCRSHDNVAARIQQKPFWLSPDFEVDEADDMSNRGLLPVDRMQNSLTSHFQESSSPRLVCLLGRESGHWREFDRIFIVPESWPGEAPSR